MTGAADARRRRRGRDGRATAPVDDGDACASRRPSQPGDHVRPRRRRHRARATWSSTAGTTLTAGASRRARERRRASRSRVRRRPRVGVLSTGDELVEGGAPLRPGQFRDSNRHALLPLVAAAGCEAVDLGLVRDDEAAVTAAIEARRAHVRRAAHERRRQHGRLRRGEGRARPTSRRHAVDADRHPSGEAVRLRRSSRGRSVPVFGLPGNPVSSIVSFELLARPALRRMIGHGADDLDRPRLAAIADDAAAPPSRRQAHFVRVVVVASTRRRARRPIRRRPGVAPARRDGRRQRARGARRTATASMPATTSRSSSSVSSCNRPVAWPS